MKKKTSVELRFYELPHNKDVIALLGEHWIREYGLDENGKVLPTNHFHNLMEIGVCRDGQGTMIYDRTRYQYKKGDITIIPGNYPHNTKNNAGEKSAWEYLFIDPLRFLNQNFQRNRGNQEWILQKITGQPLFLHQEDAPRIAAYIDLMMDIEREQMQFGQEALRGLLYTFLTEAACYGSEQPLAPMGASKELGQMSQIQMGIEYMHEHYEDVQLRIADLAKVSNMSETYFRRLFQQYYQMPPLEYLNLIRIHGAIRALAKSNQSLEEIAAATGFDTVPTLIRNFKKYIGETPYQWKKSAHQKGGNLFEYHISVQNGWE